MSESGYRILLLLCVLVFLLSVLVSVLVSARLALRLKETIAAEAKEKQREAGGAVRQKSDKAEIDTKKELAKVAGVSHDTIHKVVRNETHQVM